MYKGILALGFGMLTMGKAIAGEIMDNYRNKELFLLMYNNTEKDGNWCSFLTEAGRHTYQDTDRKKGFDKLNIDPIESAKESTEHTNERVAQDEVCIDEIVRGIFNDATEIFRNTVQQFPIRGLGLPTTDKYGLVNFVKEGSTYMAFGHLNRNDDVTEAGFNDPIKIEYNMEKKRLSILRQNHFYIVLDRERVTDPDIQKVFIEFEDAVKLYDIRAETKANEEAEEAARTNAEFEELLESLKQEK